MLDKLKIITVLGIALGLLRALVPGLEVGEEFEEAAAMLVNALFVLIPVIAAWFTKERKANIDALVER